MLEDDKGPAFAYTVGLYHSFGYPELIVVGLPPEVGHSVLNIAGESIRRGVGYSEGTQSDEFLEDRGCVFRRMPESQYRHYLGWDLWFYDGTPFPALQVIWADQHGRWPWEPTVDPGVRERQPVIEDQGDPPWARGASGERITKSTSSSCPQSGLSQITLASIGTTDEALRGTTNVTCVCLLIAASVDQSLLLARRLLSWQRIRSM